MKKYIKKYEEIPNVKVPKIFDKEKKNKKLF